MEPIRITPPELLSVQNELIQYEQILLRPEHGTTRQTFESITSDEFWETGASGRRYSRTFIIDTMIQRYSAPYEDRWVAEDFYCQMVSPGHYLLTYTLHQGPRITQRMTLWRKQQNLWVAVYHQGTMVVGAREKAVE